MSYQCFSIRRTRNVTGAVLCIFKAWWVDRIRSSFGSYSCKPYGIRSTSNNIQYFKNNIHKFRNNNHIIVPLRKKLNYFLSNRNSNPKSGSYWMWILFHKVYRNKIQNWILFYLPIKLWKYITLPLWHFWSF